jgi:hypothetical protein
LFKRKTQLKNKNGNGKRDFLKESSFAFDYFESEYKRKREQRAAVNQTTILQLEFTLPIPSGLSHRFCVK